MNSGHKSFVNSGSGTVNPLSNEVAGNRSLDSSAFGGIMGRNREERINKQPVFNPLTSQAINYNDGSQIAVNTTGSSSKVMVPSTTSKVYGNFLDAKQIDQMIN